MHGLLTGNVSVTGRGSSWPQIKPTLQGSGQLQLANGKLVGVNIVALAINGIASAPGVSQLLDATFMSSHSDLLADPDTDLTNASLSFALAGPRVTTHNLAAQSQFYGINGDGWFDMDKNIDMDTDIQLTFGLSVAIPVWVNGQLPAVIVLPNLPKLTERIAMGAINLPGKIIRGGMNAVGSMFGGSSSPPLKSAPPSSFPNPLNTLRNLIHDPEVASDLIMTTHVIAETRAARFAESPKRSPEARESAGGVNREACAQLLAYPCSALSEKAGLSLGRLGSSR